MQNGNTHTWLMEYLPALRAHVEPQIPARLRREIDVDDVLQDVLQSVIRLHGSRGYSGIDNMYAYLRTATSSVLVDKIRRFESLKRGGGDSSVRVLHDNDRTSYLNLFDKVSGKDPTPSKCAAAEENAKHIHFALERIPEDQRTAVHLCYIVGLSHKQAGQQMGRSVQSIHGLVIRGLSSLRSELKYASHYLSDVPSEV